MANIQRNGFYNDPGLAQAASNLAGLFAPPSGSDAAGWAAANAKNAEAQRLAALYAYARDPNFNQQQFDRLGVGAGAYAPTQSYYAVDTGAATTRRGQDVDAATSRANNANTVRGGVIGQMYQPLNPGQVRPEVPVDIAGAVGLPAMAGTAGAPKPLSETEARGADYQALRGDGSLTNQMIVDSIVGKEAPVQALGPGGTPQYMSPGAAVRQGAQPFVNRGAEAKPQNYRTPDGKVGTATVSGGGLVDTQSGQPVPQGSVVFGTNVQGTAEQVLGPTTANQTSANNRAAELKRTQDTLDLYEGILDRNPAAVGLPGLIRGTAQNAVQVLGDLSGAFGKSAPELQGAADEIRRGLGGVAPELFDPAIPEASFLQGTLAYALARTENPSGEVSRQAYDRALERIQGGFLQNTASAKASLGAFRRVLQTEAGAIGALRQPGAPQIAAPPAQAPAMPTSTGVERWERDPASGQLRKVQ